MPRVCVLVPFPLDDTAVANRRRQQRSVRLSPDMELEYKPVKAGPALLDSYHDYTLAHLSMLEAGLEAADEGFDAICIDTTSDSGANALRSMLDIPIVAPGRASYLTALMLGNRFSVLTQWDGWIPVYVNGVNELGLGNHLASVRSINMMPDLANLLGGKEDVVFPLLREEGMKCVQDGADVICLGSTTMHDAHSYLAENLPVPVINPGPLTYKLAEAMLSLGLSQSRRAFPRPGVPKPEMVRAMIAAAARSEAGATDA